MFLLNTQIKSTLLSPNRRGKRRSLHSGLEVVYVNNTNTSLKFVNFVIKSMDQNSHDAAKYD
jgi:hypothetical protein